MKSKLSEIRSAFSDYVRTEGCSCCRDNDGHKAASERIGKLLGFKKYSDGSGYDFYDNGKKNEKKVDSVKCEECGVRTATLQCPKCGTKVCNLCNDEGRCPECAPSLIGIKGSKRVSHNKRKKG